MQLKVLLKCLSKGRPTKPPWYNFELRALIRKRQKLYAKWKKSAKLKDKLAYNKIRNLLQRKIVEAKLPKENLQFIK